MKLNKFSNIRVCTSNCVQVFPLAENEETLKFERLYQCKYNSTRSANRPHFFSASILRRNQNRIPIPVPVFHPHPTMIPRNLPLALLSVLLLSPCCSAATVDMGKIIMQLKSSVTSENEVLSAHMLSITSKYMNNYFKAYYANKKSSTYFSSATLRVKPFDVQGDTGSYVTTVEFAGMLSFKVDPAPSHSFVDTLTVNAFEGNNLDLYIDSLLESESKFLSNLLNIVVEVRDNPIMEKNLEDNAETNKENAVEQPEDGLLKGWTAILIYGMAIVAGVMLSVAMFCLCRCCCREKRQINDHGETVNLKSIEVPKKVDRRIQKENRKNRRSTARTPAAPAQPKTINDSFYSGKPPPSPEPSITSQDSSKFTYNPDEGSVMSCTTGGMSLMSKASLGLGNYNGVVGSDMSMTFDPHSRKHQRHDTSTNPPLSFGHDTSTNDPSYRNLDLIEEGNEATYDDYRPRSSRHQATNSASLEIRKPRRSGRPASKLRAPKTRYGSNGSAFGNGSDYLTESSSSPSSRGSDDSSKDVIDDLRDLSFQIQMHRSGRR